VQASNVVHMKGLFKLSRVVNQLRSQLQLPQRIEGDCNAFSILRLFESSQRMSQAGLLCSAPGNGA